MPRTLIIGYGNPLRGDDAVGYLAAERLLQRIHDPDIEVLAVQQLTPELMEPVSQADRVIFIDASAEGEPGTILATPVESDPAPGPALTHFATPGALLAGVQALYEKAPAAMLICIAGRDFAIGDRLSEPVQLALEDLLQSQMSGIVAKWSPPPALCL